MEQVSHRLLMVNFNEAHTNMTKAAERLIEVDENLAKRAVQISVAIDALHHDAFTILRDTTGDQG